LIFVAGAVVAGLVLQRGNLTELGSDGATAKAEAEFEEPPRIHTVRVRVGCR
jgi:hypothetical protein